MIELLLVYLMRFMLSYCPHDNNNDIQWREYSLRCSLASLDISYTHFQILNDDASEKVLSSDTW